MPSISNEFYRAAVAANVRSSGRVFIPDQKITTGILSGFRSGFLSGIPSGLQVLF